MNLGERFVIACMVVWVGWVSGPWWLMLVVLLIGLGLNLANERWWRIGLEKPHVLRLQAVKVREERGGGHGRADS